METTAVYSKKNRTEGKQNEKTEANVNMFNDMNTVVSNEIELNSNANTEDVALKSLSRYLSKVDMKNVFLPSKDARQLLALCNACQEDAAFGLVIGRSGFGKTFTLKHYSKMNKVCYIECNDSMSRKDILMEIEKKLGLPAMAGSINNRLGLIKQFFDINKGWIIIIDEADKLISRDTCKKIEMLRNLFDNEEQSQGRMGLLIAGEPVLKGMIVGHITRIETRIDFSYELQGITGNEVREYLKKYKFTSEAMAEMIARGTSGRKGCFRFLNRTLKNVRRLVGEDDEITIDVIIKASEMMLL